MIERTDPYIWIMPPAHVPSHQGSSQPWISACVTGVQIPAAERTGSPLRRLASSTAPGRKQPDYSTWLTVPTSYSPRTPPMPLTWVCVGFYLPAIMWSVPVSYTHLRAHETVLDL